MRSVKIVLAVTVLLAFSAVAQASILIDQTGTPWGNRRADSQAIADDFTLATAATIQAVGVNGSFSEGPMGGAVIDSFDVNFYNNNAGAPGTAVSTQHITTGWSVSSGLFTIPLADVSVSGATTYWLSIKANVSGGFGMGEFKVQWANGDDPGFTYSTVGSPAYNPSDSTSNGRYWYNYVMGPSWQTGTYTGTYTGSFPGGWSSGDNSHPQGLDLAFSLTGTAGAPIPEPSSIVLVGMGILGLLAYAWRKRK